MEWWNDGGKEKGEENPGMPKVLSVVEGME